MAKKNAKKRRPTPVPAKPGAAAAKAPSRPAAARARQPRIPVFWITLGAVLVIAAVAAIVASRDDGKNSANGGATGHEYGKVTVHGDALPQLPESGKDPATGDTIPTVDGENFAGAPVTITPNGKAQMVVFLAHWCPHCNREAPKLAAYLQQHGGVPAGVTLTIVPTGSSAQAPNWPPSQWVKTMGLGSVTTLVDDQAQTAASAFGLSAYPFIVSVDAQGNVVDRRSGEQADGFFARAFQALASGSTFPQS